MMEERETPIMGEVVVCKVTKVMGYGAFVELVEYDNSRGFVHISQVATRWIKNIRNHVKEGQVRAAKVLALHPERRQIDLSLTKVSSHMQRSRIEEWKQLKRSKKLIELLAKKHNSTFDQAWGAIAKPLLNEYDSLQQGFQQIALKGEEAAKGVDKKWLLPLVELVQRSVAVPEKTVEGVLTLRSIDPGGVEIIKKALQHGLDASSKRAKIFYAGSGKYVVRATSADFKTAEKLLDKTAAAVEAEMKQAGGKALFERSE